SLQLPFYATALTQADATRTVSALALVRLHAREVSAKGLAGVDLGLPGVPQVDAEAGGSNRWLRDFAEHDWDGWLATWHASFARLADEFIAGHAENRVTDLGDLNYCDVMPFLRLNL